MLPIVRKTRARSTTGKETHIFMMYLKVYQINKVYLAPLLERLEPDLLQVDK